MRSRRCQFLQPDHGLQRRARHRNHARMTHAHGIRRPADARAQGQRYRPLQGFETAGLHHLARTLGHKLGIPYLRSNGGHAPVPGTAVRTGLNTSEKCNGCRAFHKPERRGGAGPAGLCRARAALCDKGTRRCPCVAAWRPTLRAPARAREGSGFGQRDAQHAAQRLGGAHSSWSPTVKAPRYCGPIDSLRRRPTGMSSVPVTATGVSARTVSSLVLGTTLAHCVPWAISDSISSIGRSRFELDGQRLAVAAHGADTHAQAVDRGGGRAEGGAAAQDLVGLDLALPLFLGHAVAQILVDPGIRLPPSGTPKCSWGSAGSCCLASTPRSISGWRTRDRPAAA